MDLIERLIGSSFLTEAKASLSNPSLAKAPSYDSTNDIQEHQERGSASEETKDTP